jgi:hypothetical protein
MRKTSSDFVSTLEDLFGVPAQSLREEDSRETVAEWSSLADVQMFALIKSDLGIEPDAEIIEAETVGHLLQILRSRGAFHD